MRNHVALKLAASSAVISLTMAGCTSGNHPAFVSNSAPRQQAPKQQAKATDLYSQVEAAAAQRDYAKALALAEQAVELSPRDVAYRMILADLYVKNGRFASAEATYDDVLALNPDNRHAAMNLVLAQIAQGRKGAALATLEGPAANASASDRGLAYALAGETDRALDMLEAAARVEGADARVRQNLALAYALAGKWQKARTIAAQDLSPIEIGPRMEAWAHFAQPRTSYDQVAGLLGVAPAADPGQPVRLALAPAAPEPVAVAQAEPVPAPVTAAPAMSMAVAASVDPVASAAIMTPAEVATAAPVEAAPAAPVTEEVRYAAAAEALVKPAPAVIKAVAAPYKTPVAAFEPSRKLRAAVAQIRPVPLLAASRYVVQLGAYSQQASIERAWQTARLRYGFGGGQQALTTTISLPGKGMLHRLSVSGFQTRIDATRVCAAIQAKGGTCFVREIAGDAPVQWASLRTRRG